MTPRESVEAACREQGAINVVKACVGLLNGEELTAELGDMLGGPASHTVLHGGEGGPLGYWTRTWALRGLLYAWDSSAEAAVIKSLSDEAWRVREMAAKVITRQRIGDAFSALALVQNDPITRVRSAAQRALVTLVDHEA
jgi:hypothetical protein